MKAENITHILFYTLFFTVKQNSRQESQLTTLTVLYLFFFVTFDLASVREITCHCEIVPTIIKCVVSWSGPGCMKALKPETHCTLTLLPPPQLPLLTVWIKTALFVTLNRIDLISSFALHHLYSALFLFHWFALYLPCALCHFIYFYYYFIYFLFFTCPYLYICNSCILCMYVCVCMCICVYICVYIYIYLICIYLYFYVLLLVFSVICMHQGSESNAISILCMYVRYMWQNWQ